jgi:uncharacterized protein (TIGR02594 family)
MSENLTFQVNASRLRIRTGPGTDYNIWGSLLKGETFNSPLTDGWVPIIMDDGTIGWVSAAYVKQVQEDQLPEVKKAPWMKVALAERGVSEIAGSRDNPRILEYLRVSNPAGAREQELHDEIYWCAAFVGWVFITWGVPGTGTWWARDYLHWGNPVEEPYPGCVVVFARGSAGHVGFYLDENDESYLVYGGNQSNQVCQAWHGKDSFLGFREPALAA